MFTKIVRFVDENTHGKSNIFTESRNINKNNFALRLMENAKSKS